MAKDPTYLIRLPKGIGVKLMGSRDEWFEKGPAKQTGPNEWVIVVIVHNPRQRTLDILGEIKKEQAKDGR